MERIFSAAPNVSRVRFFNTYEPVTDFYRDLIPALAAKRIDSVVVVSASRYRDGRANLTNALASSGAKIIHVSSGIGLADSRVRKLWTLLTYTIGAALRAALGAPAGVNFFLTQPPLFSAMGAFVKRWRGQPYCCLVMDLYPDVLAADGTIAENGWTFSVLRRLSRLALRRADLVFVIGRCMRDRLLAEGLDASRVEVVHNWAHEDKVRPVVRSQNPLARKYNLRDEFVVLYSGNMGVAHSFETILAVAARLRSRVDIRFIFLGQGARRNELIRAVTSENLSNVTVGDLQPESMLAFSQSLGDVHFVSLREEFTGLMVPSKAYSTLAAGRPLIYEGCADGEIARMVREEQVGYVINCGDVDAMEAALLAMADDRAATRAMGVRARALATGRYGREEAVNRYVASISALSGYRAHGGERDAT